MKLPSHYEKPSEKRVREERTVLRRARVGLSLKALKKKMQLEGFFTK